MKRLDRFIQKIRFFVAPYLVVITIECDHDKLTMLAAHCMPGIRFQSNKRTINQYNNYIFPSTDRPLPGRFARRKSVWNGPSSVTTLKN